jgi:hypothetical protein
MSRASRLAVWRASIALAAAVIGASLWLGYELAQTIRFFAGIADYFGRPILGLLVPGVYIWRVWSRAFPRSPR